MAEPQISAHRKARYRVSRRPMKTFHRIAVYCASSNQIDPAYAAAATAMGHAMADQNIGLVFGGGSVGLMGTIADAMIDRGGEVIGVIPQKLQDLELGHPGCTALHVVDTMHERKQMMMDFADAFIAMPGGFGTLEELFEVVTWAQLNFHMKPVGILNVEGFYDDLVRFIHHAVDKGFVREELRHLITVDKTPMGLLENLHQATVPDLATWLPVPPTRGT